jgi:hypothetical protein
LAATADAEIRAHLHDAGAEHIDGGTVVLASSVRSLKDWAARRRGAIEKSSSSFLIL